ncbi:L-ascorbate oxidase [Microdochium nivale]|nr:L-ascorbate oxidase [Microdochium nivale]
MSATNRAEPPSTRPWVYLNGSLISPSTTSLMDETKLAPYPERPPPARTDHTLKFFVNMTGLSTWALNIGPHQAFRQQLPPLLWEEDSRGVTTYGGGGDGDGDHTSDKGTMTNGSVVDIIFSNGANVTSQHPFHKHNTKAWIIGTGTGGFPWASVDEAIREHPRIAADFNFADPPLRDGCRLGNQTGDWTAIRYQITFPAASMLHCHMIHHFAVSLLGRSDMLFGLLFGRPPSPFPQWQASKSYC